jgi:formylmethanofuran dehydrogenase subunit B
VARASGWLTATFAEVANRADFIFLVGADPARSFPRFHERLVTPRAPLYRSSPPVVAYLGPAALAPAAQAVSLSATVAEADLLDALRVLAATLRGRRPRAIPSTLPGAELGTIAERLSAARYGAVVWDVGSFAPPQAELVVELLASMLRHLNVSTRCVGLPLGGSDNGIGAMQATLWQTGWPLRVGFGAGSPQHDPWTFDGARRLAAGECDLLLWVGALAADPPPLTAAPMIALLADDVVLPAPAAVEIRVGIPGIHHAGEVLRSDTTVALPLQAARPADRPSVADAARAILAALEASS